MRVVPLCLACLGLLCLPACHTRGSAAAPTPAAAKPDPDNHYQVIMWMLGDTPGNGDRLYQRLQDLNVTGVSLGTGESPEAARTHDLGFYVENLHRIAFMFSTEHIYTADRDAYVKTREKKYLIRKPSLNDPAFFADAKQDIQKKVRPYVGAKPLLYNLGDECSVTSFASPMDYDFSPTALAAFRTWLQGQYGTLEKLNAEWETHFATWDDVQPMTTYEIKDRERAGSENYSPWADHRTFMDLSYAEAWRQFREYVREVDPKTPVGLEGTQHPSAFGGYDLWRLSQVVDWLEPYDIGESHGIFRSFLPEGAPIYSTLFEHDANQASRRLWHLLLNGDRGTIIWASSEWFDYQSPDLTPKPWVASMSRLFAELRGPAAQAVMSAHRDRAPIALLYSQPGIQVAWMLDSREDRDTWPKRHGSWDSVYGRAIRDRSGWCRLLEDLSLQYDFVSTDQLHDGTLAARRYGVLVLPAAYALSDRDAAAIEAFAKQGGTVIADYLPGVFDEHGKRRAQGVFDSLFGISRPCKQIEQPEKSFEAGEQVVAAEPDLSVDFAERPLGSGKMCYLNRTLIEYGKRRLEGKGVSLRRPIDSLLQEAGVWPPGFHITLAGGPPVGCEVITYHREGAGYIAIMRNPEYRVGELGDLGYGDNRLFEKPAQVALHCDRPVNAKELMSGKTFAQAKTVELTLDPWKPLIVEVQWRRSQH